MATDWITTGEAARQSAYHPERIRTLIREGKIEAKKFGIVWMVSKSSVLLYMRQVQRMGEKRGPKKRLTDKT